MNKKFKAGDIVVLAEGNRLDNMETILAKENHLFEVESLWGNDKVDLKSISTGFKTGAHIEDVRHATLKEQYLRDGNSVVIDDIGYLVSGNTIICLKSGFNTNYFCDDLSTTSGIKTITKVFNSTSWNFEDKIDINHEAATVLWERKQKIELTSNEVIILKNISKKYKYIVRDGGSNGSLFVYETKPVKSDIYNEYFISDDTDFEYLSPFNHLFQDITFESKPCLIADLIKEKKNETI